MKNEISRARKLQKINKRLRNFLMFTLLTIILLSGLVVERVLKLKNLYEQSKDRVNYSSTINTLAQTINQMKIINDKAEENLVKSLNLLTQQEKTIKFSQITGELIDSLPKCSISYKTLYEIIQIAYNNTDKLGNGSYNWIDMIALAYIESRFNAKCVGKFGEVGLWQILDWKNELKIVGGKDPFDIMTNFKMSCSILNEKFKKFPDFKYAIIAYNGYIIKDEEVIDKYWLIFEDTRKKIKEIIKLGGIDV